MRERFAEESVVRRGRDAGRPGDTAFDCARRDPAHRAAEEGRRESRRGKGEKVNRYFLTVAIFLAGACGGFAASASLVEVKSYPPEVHLTSSNTLQRLVVQA